MNTSPSALRSALGAGQFLAGAVYAFAVAREQVTSHEVAQHVGSRFSTTPKAVARILRDLGWARKAGKTVRYERPARPRCPACQGSQVLWVRPLHQVEGEHVPCPTCRPAGAPSAPAAGPSQIPPAPQPVLSAAEGPADEDAVETAVHLEAAAYVDEQDCRVQNRHGDWDGYTGQQMVEAFLAGRASLAKPIQVEGPAGERAEPLNCPLCAAPMLRDGDTWSHDKSHDEGCFLIFQELQDADDIWRWNNIRHAALAQSSPEPVEEPREGFAYACPVCRSTDDCPHRAFLNRAAEKAQRQAPEPVERVAVPSFVAHMPGSVAQAAAEPIERVDAERTEGQGDAVERARKAVLEIRQRHSLGLTTDLDGDIVRAVLASQPTEGIPGDASIDEGERR